MNKKIYNLMDWAGIEEIVYAEAVHPERLLGATNEQESIELLDLKLQLE